MFYCTSMLPFFTFNKQSVTQVSKFCGHSFGIENPQILEHDKMNLRLCCFEIYLNYMMHMRTSLSQAHKDCNLLTLPVSKKKRL